MLGKREREREREEERREGCQSAVVMPELILLAVHSVVLPHRNSARSVGEGRGEFNVDERDMDRRMPHPAPQPPPQGELSVGD